ncbi:EamA family transporter [Microbacterium marinilacus]|uniref:EamA family transporter n=1 Tax=Microbacterium marinilacus TaxID=415209 RepID=UPI003CD055AC
MYWYLLRRIGVTRVNSLMFLVPPATALWGAAMFGEPLGVATITGIVVALAATWLATRAPTPAAGGGEPRPRHAT